MVPGTLFLKLAVALVAVTVAAVSLSAWLNTLRFEATQTTLVERRLRMALDDVRRDILVGLDLGLKPAEMEGLDALLGRALAIMPTLRSAVVYDCAGRTLAAAGAPVAGQAAIAVKGRLRDDAWISLGDDLAAGGVALTDALGDCAGSVVMVLDDAPRQAALAAVGDRLWQAAAASLLLLVPALAVVRRVLRRRSGLVSHLSHDLDGLLSGAAPADRHAVGLTSREALTGGERRMIAAYRAARSALRGSAGRGTP